MYSNKVLPVNVEEKAPMAMSVQGQPAPTLNAVLAQSPHAIWRANQMGAYRGGVTPSGYAALDAQLPGGGWPSGALIEILPQQTGIGEIRLLRPALKSIARQRRVALVQPPHMPLAAAWCAWGLAAERLLLIRAKATGDCLWAAEQILRNGSCGALVFWQNHIRPEALRRLHLAAQGSETVFWMVRPLAVAQDSSPATLRLGIRPAHGGIDIDCIKRRGPQMDAAFYLALGDDPAPNSTSLLDQHAILDRRASAAAVARNVSPALV